MSFSAQMNDSSERSLGGRVVVVVVCSGYFELGVVDVVYIQKINSQVVYSNVVEITVILP